MRRDETEAAWRWIDAVAEGWRERDIKPVPYAAGTDGPPDVHRLIGRDGRGWVD